MDNEVMISVIIPVYNVEKYLRECIESVQVQTYTNWELILIDDGSTDRSGIICDELALKDSRIKVIHKKNEGVSKARNTGLDVAVGRYIVFIDSDDYVDCNMLHDYCAAIVENDADCVVSGLVFFYDAQKKDPIAINSQCIDLFAEINDVFHEFRSKHVFSALYSKMYKRSIVEKQKIRMSEEHSILEDGMFVIDYFMACKRICCIDSTPYFYRQYQEMSLMKRYNKNALSAWETYYRKFAKLSVRLDENNKSEMQDIFVAYYLSFLHQIYSRSFLNGKEKYKLLTEYLNKAKELKLFEKQKRENSLQKMLLIFLAKFRISSVIHLLLCFKYRAKKVMG